MQVAGEAVRHADKRPAAPLLVDRVLADVAEIQVEQAVVVEVEEHRSGRVPDVIDAGGLRDVAEVAHAVVLEQHVPFAHGGHEQILIAVVVDVGKRRRSR